MVNKGRRQTLMSILVLASVVAVGFLCGWAATGLVGGAVTALALGTGAGVATLSCRGGIASGLQIGHPRRHPW